MPPFPGEDRMLTVFADVHYYFTAPTTKPAYHRFDKGSYLYVYNDPSRGSARIEIANNPGTFDQDAFYGVLDHVHLRHSTRFPTLCTLTVNGQVQDSPVSSHSPTESDHGQWLLPSADPRDDGHRLLRLHTLDLYFWTLDDANLFLDTVERTASPSQIESDRHPQQHAPDAGVSKVVQKLENVAITDPAYQNGRTRNSRSDSGIATQETSSKGQEAAANFAPLTYNPAAPAAPEPIQHREKTPPPTDGAEGTGLAAAAVDHGHYYSSQQVPGGFAQTPGHQVPGMAQFGYSSPPPSAGLPRGSISSHSSLHSPPGVASFAPPPVASTPSAQTGGLSFAPLSQDINTHLYGQQVFGAQHVHGRQPQYADYLQSQSHDPQAPIGGYSDYTYSQPVRHQYNPSGSEYDVHSQLYRPTESEARSHSQKHAKQAMKNPNSRPHKLEDTAERVENKLNGILKKIEKKIG